MDTVRVVTVSWFWHFVGEVVLWLLIVALLVGLERSLGAPVRWTFWAGIVPGSVLWYLLKRARALPDRKFSR
jgi:hypothetical protein